MRRLFEGDAYLSNYCNLQLKSLLHLGQNVITFRTLLHLGPLQTETIGRFVPKEKEMRFQLITCGRSLL